jgi:hypothetical protein
MLLQLPGTPDPVLTLAINQTHLSTLLQGHHSGISSLSLLTPAEIIRIASPGDPMSKTPFKKKAGGVAQGVGPELKPHYFAKKKIFFKF